MSPGVGISGRCATALPGSHLWGQSPPSMGPRPCPRKATALRHGRSPTTTLAPPLLHIASSLPKAMLRSIAREKNLTILGGARRGGMDKVWTRLRTQGWIILSGWIKREINYATQSLIYYRVWKIVVFSLSSHLSFFFS